MENLSDNLFMLLFIVPAREYGGKVVYFPPESAYFLCIYYV